MPSTTSGGGRGEASTLSTAVEAMGRVGVNRVDYMR